MFLKLCEPLWLSSMARNIQDATAFLSLRIKFELVLLYLTGKTIGFHLWDSVILHKLRKYYKVVNFLKHVLNYEIAIKNF